LQLLFLKYGRDAEHQADELGFRYSLGLGYDVREMADVFRTLERAGEAEGQSPLPTWLSTHPYPAERIQRTGERIAALQPPQANATLRRPEYMNEIDGLIYGENPRNGYFRGSSFLHPDLRFRLDFPHGWRTQNLPQAVMAGSPQQDAAIQLTFAQGSPETAARQFLGQQGIQSAQPRSQTVNGLPAVSAQFRAQTEQGVVDGVALFVSHGGNTYMLLGYAPSQRFASYQTALQQSLGSFARLTDPQALDVRPNRVAIVRVQQATTLAEFNRRNPSVIDLAELALINQVSDPNATVPAGTLLKRVVAG
ncbi:MAG: M48 family metalloprotease, partial [Burkholderiales bacterium]